MKARIKKVKHGFSRRGQKTLEYHIWRAMIERCHNPNNKNYNRYGGRGIIVCAEWRSDFTKFLSDMGTKPFAKATIERIQTNGNYEKSNCKWATWKEQQNNKSSNKILTLNGESLTVSQWIDKTGLKRGMVYQRIYRGWSDERILTTR